MSSCAELLRRLLLGAVLALLWPAATVAAAELVGSAVCSGCHAEQARRWAASHHAGAMQVATPQTVLGRFGSAARPVRFELAGQRTEFLRRNGQYRVRTAAAADGRLQDYVVTHTIGLYPLQQYLLALPGGRLQALGVAWDARPRHEGGQRWFHLYADDPPQPGEPTHWSGRAQNWNAMCAACHVTGWRKNHDAGTGRYDSRWSESGVGCEACHGAGSGHVAWARRPLRGPDPARGFAQPVAALRPPVFAFQPAAARPIAVNQGSVAQGQAAGEVCWGCHARRGELSAALQAGVPFLDQYRPSLIEPGLYLADGRLDGEVFEFGSFAQSAMHRAGVSCGHCHDSHDGRLRATGNALCSQCHLPSHYDRQAHHGQDPAASAGQCTRCHMPTRTYMGVHERHDHSLRVPGATNAASSMARASALAARPQRAALQAATQDPDELLRLGAARGLAALPPQEALGPGLALLTDPRRAVRIEAARSLLGLPRAWWSAAGQVAFDAALTELIAAEQLATDRPEAWLNLGLIHASQGRLDQAEAALRSALRQAPDFVPALVNLADLYRQMRRDEAAEALLRAAVAQAPQQAEPAHALGLLLLRRQQLAVALPSLERAWQLAPAELRYGRTLLLAQLEAGRRADAAATLVELQRQHPGAAALDALQQRLERARNPP